MNNKPVHLYPLMGKQLHFLIFYSPITPSMALWASPPGVGGGSAGGGVGLLVCCYIR